ncbi:DUF4270 domain-containing protein [Pontimicrobium sp. IMCC45349]|uniref:DUF4270 domain-containing protein n=1 Tax=Pontimicrobium sp. IMCC45349 TaxID=3391574 RepID=UPI0039A3B39A
MKKRKLVLKNIALLAFISLGFIACERDFTEIGTGIVGDDNFNTTSQTYPVITYNKRVTPIQSNALPDNLLGFYNDPDFGETTVNFVSQLTPSKIDPTFGDNVVLDSVILTIPFYSSAIDLDDENNVVYELDSVYPKNNFTPMNISIYRSDYFLRDFDPTEDFETSQKYYSNGATSENDIISPTQLEGELIYSVEEFTPNEEIIILTEENEDGEQEETSRLVPSIRLNLIDQPDNFDQVFWENLIFAKEGEPELSNLNNFYDYFRGLYFKIDSEDGNGTLMQLDLSDTDKSTLIMYYTSDITSTINDEEQVEERQGEYEMTFSGNRVNIFNNQFNPQILQEIQDADPVNGDERLFLKGGEGSMAIIDIFTEDEEGNTFNDYMNEYRSTDDSGNIIETKRLVNEAYIEFYVDHLNSQNDPNRVYLYDLKNNLPLIDHFLDVTTNTTSNDGKFRHLVPLETIEDELGVVISKKYKVRVTEHINNMILRDSSNVKLGLVVTSNVSSTTNYNVLNEEENFTNFPSGAILTPKSTILHGSKSSDEDKKVKLKIYYTEPNN